MSPPPGTDADGARQEPAEPRGGLASVVRRFSARGRPCSQDRRPAGA